jgi:hypothetical protein
MLYLPTSSDYLDPRCANAFMPFPSGSIFLLDAGHDKQADM